MRFVLLGPVHAVAGDRPVDLGPARQRCVLAALLAEPGRSVPTDALIARVWGSDAPGSVHSALYSYITRLRDVLRYAGGGQTLIRADGGYRLTARTDEVDLWHWNRLIEQAKSASADARRELLGQALQLWNGRALGNLTSDWAEQTRQRLEHQRIETLAEWAELEIAAGRPAQAALALTESVADHPVAERLVATLMRALHLCGRSAEALEWHAKARERIASEFGVEPGPALRELHLEILRADRDVRPSTPGRGPAQLPAAVADFAGRPGELARLDVLLGPDPDAPPNGARIVIVAGTAGVGKTALAVHWAHRAAGRFADGQLYVNLHGYSTRPPLEPARALELLLQGLGVAADRIPADLDARVGFYRSTIAGRRMLVVLDNAGSVEQVRPLLPGDPGCGVLITSRDALGGLVAVDGAHRIHLDVLGQDEAIALLTDLLPTHGSPESLTRLANVCARLPLALRIAAANLGGQPIDEYVHSLAADPLRGLSVDGDPDAVVGVQFEYSYRNLDPDAQRLFRLLGSLPGVDASVSSAAALLGSTIDDAATLLRRLVNAHLIEPAWGRYAFHDLLRAYAAQWAAADPEVDAALLRFFDWHLSAASAAVDVVDPNGRRVVAVETMPPAVSFDDYQTALAWLDQERPNLVALTAMAVDRGWYERAWRLPQVLWAYFYIRSGVLDWTAAHELALTAALRLGDPRAEAETLNSLAKADRRAGRYVLARERLERVLELFEQADDQLGVVVALADLASVNQRLGNLALAIGCCERALALRERIGDRPHGTVVLANLAGLRHYYAGEYQEEVRALDQAIVLLRQLGDRRGEAVALANLALAHQLLGDYERAIEQHQQALAQHRHNGDRDGEATVLGNLGCTYFQVGRYPEALAHQQDALALAREIAEPDLEAEHENDLGETRRALADHVGALADHRRALDLATATGNRRQLARAHRGLARAQHELGEHAAARPHWRSALDIYAELGPAEADELRKELAGLDDVCAYSPSS